MPAVFVLARVSLLLCQYRDNFIGVKKKGKEKHRLRLCNNVRKLK